MSFGEAASRRVGARRVDDAVPCPCGSGDLFGGCCGPLLRGAPAPTAERLMRSRYTAFFVGDSKYLAESWHPRTRPESIDLDEDVRWTGLQIVDVEAGGGQETSGVVEFAASWVQGTGRSAVRGVLRERSRFVRHGARWWYVEGEVGDPDGEHA